jgi:hypothetical protein
MIFIFDLVLERIIYGIVFIYEELNYNVFRVQGSRFKVQGSRFWVQGSRFWVHGSGFMVQCRRWGIQR